MKEIDEQNNEKHVDLDYLEYLRTKNEWNQREKLLWEYLSAVVNLLLKIDKTMTEMNEKIHLAEENPKQEGKPSLIGQYRIYHPPEKGIRKGPPPVII